MHKLVRACVSAFFRFREQKRLGVKAKIIVLTSIIFFSLLAVAAPMRFSTGDFFSPSIIHAAPDSTPGDKNSSQPEDAAVTPAQTEAKAEVSSIPQPPKPGADSETCVGPGTSIGCAVAYAMSWFLGLIIWLLGWILRLLLGILLNFARYNGFASAAPVTMGWAIVRDVCNMFFIVILLVSAFSTILQYNSEFHYTKVLPKLLLTAVLINFSKTLIALLIDFSQVVMLTFVNAFYMAGANNFINALGLSKFMEYGATTTKEHDLVTPGVQVGVMILAVIMTIISIGVVLVLLMYIIARIVGLWIALIFSPIALFELAVPGKLQKGMSVFTSKYWSKLASLLTGGPVIAFLLWLTLAITQQTMTGGSGASAMGLIAPGTATPSDGPNSGIANIDAIATFIIAISMMLMALDAAVDAAGDVGGSMVKGLAGKVKGATTGAAAWFAKGGLVTSGARKSGLASYGSRLALKTGVGRIMPASVQAALQKEMVRPKVLQAERDKKRLTGLENMNAEQLEAAAKSSNPQTRAKFLQALGSDKMQKEKQAAFKKEAMKTPGMTEEQAGEIARKKATEFRAGKLDEGKKLATSRGDWDTAEAIGKQQAANPLLTKAEDRDKIIKGMLADPKKLGQLENTKDAEVARRMLSQAGIIQESAPGVATSTVTGVDSGKLEQLLNRKEIKDNKPLADALKATATHAKLSTGMLVSDLDAATVKGDSTGGRTQLITPNGAVMQNATLTSTLSGMQAGGAAVWNDAAQIKSALSQGGHLADLKVDAGGTSSGALATAAFNSINLASSTAGTSGADKEIKDIKPIIDQIETQSAAALKQVVDRIADSSSGFEAIITQHYNKFVGESKQAINKALDLMVKNADTSTAAQDALRRMAAAPGFAGLPRGIKEKIQGAA
ncbi:MAG: hypothetical protein Q7R83_01185 [bacterium]|nr:hypothetical protein [bacterium]